MPLSEAMQSSDNSAELTSEVSNNYYPLSTSTLAQPSVFPRTGGWVSNDFLGKIRSNSAPTIGAYEFFDGAFGEAVVDGMALPVCICFFCLFMYIYV